MHPQDALETGRAAAKGLRGAAVAIRVAARVAFDKAVYAAEMLDDPTDTIQNTAVTAEVAG